MIIKIAPDSTTQFELERCTKCQYDYYEVYLDGISGYMEFSKWCDCDPRPDSTLKATPPDRKPRKPKPDWVSIIKDPDKGFAIGEMWVYVETK